MLKISDRSTPTCIVVEAEGAISSAEYEAFAERFEDAVKQHGTVNLVVDIKGPSSYADMEALKDDWRFAFKDYHHARRAGWVGENRVIEALMLVFSPFTYVEEKFFRAGETDAAIEWARATD